MNKTTYTEILKVWNMETPDDFAIFSELYYEMFGEEGNIPYETDSTKSSFFPFNWWDFSSSPCLLSSVLILGFSC